MGEYYPVSLGKTVAYKGYFDFAKLWRMVRDFMGEHGYRYMEKQHNEIINETGKDIFIELDLENEVSDYVRLRIIVRATVTGLNDIEIEQDGKTLLLNDGKVNVQFESYVKTDYEGRYEKTAVLFFIRTMLEKFVYARQLKKFQNMVQSDQDTLIKEIKSYLNLFSY